jgi:hypothetical protein
MVFTTVCQWMWAIGHRLAAEERLQDIVDSPTQSPNAFSFPHFRCAWVYIHARGLQVVNVTMHCLRGEEGHNQPKAVMLLPRSGLPDVLFLSLPVIRTKYSFRLSTHARITAKETLSPLNCVCARPHQSSTPGCDVTTVDDDLVGLLHVAAGGKSLG